jgi:hypothetical protein
MTMTNINSFSTIIIIIRIRINNQILTIEQAIRYSDYLIFMQKKMKIDHGFYIKDIIRYRIHIKIIDSAYYYH